MKYIFKKALSALITLCLIFTLLPAVAFAAAGDIIPVTSEAELLQAIEDAIGGEIIRIDTPFDLTGNLTIGKSITLTATYSVAVNTSVYTITIPAGADVTFNGLLMLEGNGTSPVVSVDSGGRFTIAEDASVKQANTHTGSSAISNANGGEVTISENARVDSAYYGIENLGTLSVTGGRISGKVCAIQSSGTLEVSDGVIGSTNNTWGIQVLGGAAQITGGSIAGQSCALQVNGGDVTVSGGSFVASADDFDALFCLKGTALLSGGEFTKGLVATGASGGVGGTIHVYFPGSSGITLPNGVHFSPGGSPLPFLTALPGMSYAIRLGQPSSIPLDGVSTGVALSLDSSTDIAALGASINTTTNTINMLPTAVGSYDLVVNAQGPLPGANKQFLRLTVPVTVLSDDVCEIGSLKFPSVQDAIDFLPYHNAGATIRLLDNISQYTPLMIDDKKITFDLNDYDFIIDTTASSDPALQVINGGTVSYAGDTAFQAIAAYTAVEVKDVGSVATVSYAETTADGSYTVVAREGGQVTVKGNVQSGSKGTSYGLYAVLGGQITVDGTVTAAHSGVYSTGQNSMVTVKNGVTTTLPESVGILAANGGRAAITGDVTAGELGIYMFGSNQSEVTVKGNVTVTGNATDPSRKSAGVSVGGYGRVTVTGDVTVNGTDCTGIYSNGCTVLIGGNVSSAARGAETDNSGTITIDGTLTALDSSYIKVGNLTKGANGYEPTSTLSGYKEYRSGGNVVWVQGESSSATKEPTPNATFTATDFASGRLAGLNVDMRYSVDGGTNWLSPAGSQITIVNVTAAKGIQVKKLGNRTTTTDSDIQIITVTQAAVPTGLSKADCTTATQNDGKLIGLSTAMEYHRSDVNNWTSGTGGEITGLTNGIYFVRMKANGTMLASNDAELVIAPYGLTLISIPTANSGLKWNGSVQTGVNGGTGYTLGGTYQATDASVGGYTATVTLQSGYAWADGTTVVKNILWNISKADGPAAPTGVGGGSGKITGTTTAMEYATNTAFTNATDCSAGETTGLAAGTYYVRLKATANQEAGAYVTIILPGGGSTNPPSGGSYTPAPPTSNVVTEKQPNMPTTAKMSVPGTVKDNILSATITEQMAKDAIKAAQDAAKKSGKELDGIALNFNTSWDWGNYTDLNTTIDAGAIDRLKESGVKFIKIGSAVLDVTLDTGAIAEIDRQSTGIVTVSATRLTKLSNAAKALIGSRPVFDITVSYQKSGKTEYFTNFGKGAVTLGIAYTPHTGGKTDSSYGIGDTPYQEQSGYLYAVYVDKNGKPQLLTDSSYNNGRVIFSRNSLSTYGVGYKAPAPAFTDTAKHWAKDNIDFVASRDLISGTSATTFAPDTAITRADFLMALGRLSRADVSIYKTSSFIDVKTSDPAMPYIEWAVKSKIVQGIGSGKFGPALSITRQDMAVMMQNYAKATGYKLPVSVAAVTFSDSAKISAYAKEAVKAIQQAGIMQGKGSNTFDPRGNATRGEASTILRRFVELVIDEGTARAGVRTMPGSGSTLVRTARLSSAGSSRE